MGSASIIVGEAIAPTSPAEVPTTSATRGGVPTLASATGGEVNTFSTAPRGGVAVRASSARASPTTCGSCDLVREGDGWATGTPSGLATGLHDKTPRQNETQMRSTYTAPALRILPRHRWKPSLRPKHPRLNSRKHPLLHRSSTTLRLQSTSEGILRSLLHQLPLPLGSRLSDLLAGRSWTGNSAIVSSFSFSSSTSSSDSTSHERGVGINGVTTAGGAPLPLLLLLYGPDRSSSSSSSRS
jgi:hypothetical protein